MKSFKLVTRKAIAHSLKWNVVSLLSYLASVLYTQIGYWTKNIYSILYIYTHTVNIVAFSALTSRFPHTLWQFLKIRPNQYNKLKRNKQFGSYILNVNIVVM